MSNALPANSASFGKANILLVDQGPADLTALRSVLDHPNYNLVHAESGQQALNYLRTMPFAVVLMDLTRPESDGFDTLQEMRNDPGTRDVPVVFVTGDDFDETRAERAFGLGAVDCLVKPIHPALLRGKIRALVALSQQRQAVEAQANQLRLIIEGTTDYAIFTLDVEGRITSWNKGAQRIKGYSAADILGRHFSVFYPKKVVQQGWPHKELEIAREKGRVEDEGWRLRKDGTPFWANVVITALRDSTGTLIGFAKITRDLTERKKAEESLSQARTELEARVAQRTAELTLANQALREADRRKDDFLAMLSHELRGPLAPIRNAVQIMKIPGVGPDAVREARDLLGRQVGNLTRLVDDLLDLSRVSWGKIELRKEHLELSKVFTRAIELAQPAIDAHGHELIVSAPATPLWVVGDIVRLAQVLMNLLENAAKYTPRAGKIWLTAEPNRNDVVIRVRDTGIGIGPELLPRVFDLFVQADRSLARSQGGLGIGLTLVRHLVEMHGGSINAASPGPGEGSEFAIRLPAAKDAEAGAAQDRTLEWAGGTGPPRRVLVVDDNIDAARSVATLLRLLGHEVDCAHDGNSALERVRAFRPEIVLLDIGLPGMSGHDVARALRADPEFKDLVLIAVTGYGQEEDRRRSRKSGFDFHLTKPVAAESLAAVFTAPRGQSTAPGALGHEMNNGSC
jgi:PAS domain S-box-containing protein